MATSIEEEKTKLITRQRQLNDRIAELKLHKQIAISDHGQHPQDANTDYLIAREPLVKEQRKIEMRLAEIKLEGFNADYKIPQAPILLRIESLLIEINNKLKAPTTRKKLNGKSNSKS